MGDFSILTFLQTTGQNVGLFTRVLVIGFSLNHLENFSCLDAFLANLRHIFFLLSESFLNPSVFNAELYDM